ncbi:substrate-binding domain-containing protein, partial [Sedimentibacter sp.]
DSIFCGNDLIAIGAIKELKKNGFSIPGDVGVMGFDDIYLAGLVEPSLTTVRQPNYKMGYQAMELLLETLNDPDKKSNNFKETEVITLGTEIIERNSI